MIEGATFKSIDTPEHWRSIGHKCVRYLKKIKNDVTEIIWYDVYGAHSFMAVGTIEQIISLIDYDVNWIKEWDKTDVKPVWNYPFPYYEVDV